MPSAKQQPSNIKHGGGIRPNVWVLAFGPAVMYAVFIKLVNFYKTNKPIYSFGTQRKM